MIQNKINVLKIGKNKSERITPDITGIPPSPRYGHTMEYYPGMKIIVIYGGVTEKIFSENDDKMNSISILRITDSLIWLKVTIYGNTPDSRYSHCSSLVGSKLLIFGGISNSKYCGSTTWALELNSFERSRLKDDYIRKNTKDSPNNSGTHRNVKKELRFLV